ncbi:hypothetical protein RvY_16180-2 [Ramazzottius varieornatus]|nr:hypothetical protein RvY_16180-2 [Ramazzottius varieornatus]
MDPFLRRICDNGDGSFGHPYACGSYVQCFNGSYSEIDCPGNMYFNIKTRNCDFRRKIKCKLVDGIVETEEQSKQFGPEIPVEVEHPLKTAPSKEKRDVSGYQLHV